VKREPWLGTPAATTEVLKKYGFHFQKRYGQNFLIDPRVLRKITAAADIGPEDFVLEIGPGIGTLTQYLAFQAKKVFAVEIDDALIPVLQETLKDWDNVTIIHNDILKVDLHALVREQNEGSSIKVVANLPYYITTPILMGLMEKKVPFTSITVMVQKEVAERMQAEPGTKDYGALSVAVQYYTVPHLAATVPPNCFIPRPNVGSAVISSGEAGSACRWRLQRMSSCFSRIVRASFEQRRKTLLNSLKNARGLSFTREQIQEAIAALRFSGECQGGSTGHPSVCRAYRKRCAAVRKAAMLWLGNQKFNYGLPGALYFVNHSCICILMKHPERCRFPMLI
jgi:16S rRNA (adenine1518-N6/adenine1519-N6)-dimethyltransferase